MGFDGSGTRGDVGGGSPFHRPAVAFGARRASVPARRPAVAWSVCDPRTTSATSGRLDGLLGSCDALLRHAIPGGAPLENVPKHARSVGGTFSRTARPPVRPFTDDDCWERIGDLPRAEDLRLVDLAEGVAGPLGPERGTGGLDPPANPGAWVSASRPFRAR
jgi:hypothetical protein